MRIPLLALALLIATPAFAQTAFHYRDPEAPAWDAWSWPTNSHGPTAPLSAATAANPAFPLRVDLKLSEHHFNYFWSDFRGQGQFVVHNTLYNFRYECPDTFVTHSEFQARWTKVGRKLDILLQKTGSPHTETCTFNILNHS
jgi:hypothetical protein